MFELTIELLSRRDFLPASGTDYLLSDDWLSFEQDSAQIDYPSGEIVRWLSIFLVVDSSNSASFLFHKIERWSKVFPSFSVLNIQCVSSCLSLHFTKLFSLLFQTEYLVEVKGGEIKLFEEWQCRKSFLTRKILWKIFNNWFTTILQLQYNTLYFFPLFLPGWGKRRRN